MLQTYFANVGHNLVGAALDEGRRLITPDSND